MARVAEMPALQFSPLGEFAIVCEFGEKADVATLRHVRAFAAGLERAPLPGQTEVVPAFTSVTVFYDPARLPADTADAYEFLRELLATRAAKSGKPGKSGEHRTHFIPVCYGGEFGPDLETVAAHAHLRPEEVVRRHAAADYRVGAIGFAPGFPYLAGLPEELHTPRRAVPRTLVPAGSVGIGGAQTGIYPLATPGGWQLIGRTPRRLFRAGENPPALLRVGDRVRFKSVSREEFAALDREQTTPAAEPPTLPPQPAAARTIRVLAPGFLTTVQDLGRPHMQRHGVTPGGAMDAFALRAANLLAANDENAAALEIALAGPQLVFPDGALIALGGADLGAQLDGRALPLWRPVALPAGARLEFAGGRRGARTYLAVAGGIAVPVALGGRGTDLRTQLGGLEGRALRRGDELPLGPPPARAETWREALLARRGEPWPHWSLDAAMRPAYGAPVTVRVMPGRQFDEFTEGSRQRLLTTAFTVTEKSDRMGLRLAGGPLVRAQREELLSAAVTAGAVQVPPDGRPIVLMADRQTIGGYPRIAQVIAVDLPLLAQLRASDEVRFRQIPLAEAQALHLARERDFPRLKAGLNLQRP